MDNQNKHQNTSFCLMKCYCYRIYFLNCENTDLLANSNSVLNVWKNYFCQLLNVRGVKYVRQPEISTTGPMYLRADLLRSGHLMTS
jgi:hypothetical protein